MELKLKYPWVSIAKIQINRTAGKGFGQTVLGPGPVSVDRIHGFLRFSGTELGIKVRFQWFG
jgi:hypothetical protein